MGTHFFQNFDVVSAGRLCVQLDIAQTHTLRAETIVRRFTVRTSALKFLVVYLSDSFGVCFVFNVFVSELRFIRGFAFLFFRVAIFYSMFIRCLVTSFWRVCWAFISIVVVILFFDRCVFCSVGVQF